MKQSFFLRGSCLALGGLMALSAQALAADTVTLDIEEAVQMALRNNRAIEQAAWSREASRAELSAARRSAGPTLRWSSAMNRIGGRSYDGYKSQRAQAIAVHNAFLLGLSPTDMDPSLYPEYRQEYTNGLSISIPLYTGGRLEGQRKAARYSLNAADLELESVRQQVRYSTQAACYEYMQRLALIDVWKEALNATKEHLEQVNIKYEVGTVAYSDLLASQVEMANQQQNLVSARGNFQKSMQNLNNLIGLPVNTIVELKGDPQELLEDLDDVDSCTAYALQYRPDGIADEYTVKKLEASRQSAKAATLPSLNAVASETLSGERPFKKNHGENWALGLSLEWNIFDNGVTAAQVKKIDAQVQAARSQAAQTKENIALEVHQAYTDFITAQQNIQTTKVAVAQAETEYKLAQIRYIEGVDTNLAVTDANEKMTRARTNYYSALYQCREAKAALDKAMGLPVYIDAVHYQTAVQKGMTSEKAISAAALEEEPARKKPGEPRAPQVPAAPSAETVQEQEVEQQASAVDTAREMEGNVVEAP